MSLSSFNTLSPDIAIQTLYALCHSRPWAQQLADLRPFTSISDILHAAKNIFSSLSATEIHAAINAHPRIGTTTRSRLSAHEQSSLNATKEVLEQLKQANELYEKTFGYLYLVFASGKSAEELLTILHRRLSNTPDIEFAIARDELEKITLHRLEKFLSIQDYPLSLSTHVLNTVDGIPAIGLSVILYSHYHRCQYSQITNSDGRISSFGSIYTAIGSHFTIIFHTEEYFTAQGNQTFYPFVEVNFIVANPHNHLHVPLLISPYSYSTYRGS